MSVMCFGVLGSILRLAKGKKVPAYRLAETLLSCVTGEPCSLKDKSYLVTHLFACRRDLSNGEAAPQDDFTGGNRVSSILKCAPTADRALVEQRVADDLLPLLDADLLLPACASLMRAVMEDDSTATDRARSFERHTGISRHAFLLRRAVRPRELISTLLLYCAVCTDNREGAPFVGEITQSWFDASLPLFEGLTLLEGEETPVSEERISLYMEKAVRRARFLRTVFLRAQESDLKQFYVTNDVYTSFHGKVEGFAAPHLLDLSERLYLEAEGGMGKSCMLRHLFVTASEVYPACGLPFLAEMRNYRGGDVLAAIAEDAAPELTLSEIETLLRAGRCLFLLDGMDEVRPQLVSDAETGIADLARKYPNNRFVVSSRPCARLGALARFSPVRLLPFRLAQSLEMIERLPEGEMEPSVRQELLARLSDRVHAVDAAFTSNPLLLSILARTYAVTRKVPQDTYEFYNTAYDTLSVEHDRLKGYHGRPFYTGLQPPRLLRVITLFCAYAYYDGIYSFSENDMEKYCEAVRCRRHEFTADTDAFLKDMTENLCLMVRERGKYRFVHRTFQDYFASACFAQQGTDALEQLRLFWRDRCPAGKLVGDRALYFFYDWEPDCVIRYLLLPTLDELVADGFEGFVRREYETISYAVGETAETVQMECNSMLYAFIRSLFTQEKFLRLKDMPLLPALIVETCIMEERGMLRDVPGYEAYQRRAKPLGYVLSIDARDLYDDREEYIELVGSLAHRNSALRKEYEKVRDLRQKMRARIAHAPKFEIPTFLR